MNGKPVGDVLDGLGCAAVLDGLGCAAVLDGDDLVAAAVVVLKVVEGDGNTRLSCIWSDGLSWVERVGMLRVAEQVELPEPGSGREPDGG